MELDQKTLSIIVETSTNVKNIMEDLGEGKEVFKDHDERIRTLEKQQQYNNGKLTVVILAIGSVVTIVMNFIVLAYNKFHIFK